MSRWNDEIVADMRYAFRALRRSPVFSGAAIAVLGLGLGASTAVFSIADAVLFADLPHPEPGRLVRIYEQNSPTNLFQLSSADYLAITGLQRSFDAFGAVQRAEAAIAGTGTPQQLQIARATSGFFQALRTHAAQGRVIDARDDTPGAPAVAFVSDDFAERELGGANNATGRAITIDGVSHTVIGVLPRGVDELAGINVNVWAALRINPPTRRGPFWLRGIARVRDGVTIDAAARDLASISAQEFPLWASSFRDSTAKLTPYPLRKTIVGDADRQVGLFAGAVALVLLVAVARAGHAS